MVCGVGPHERIGGRRMEQRDLVTGLVDVTDEMLVVVDMQGDFVDGSLGTAEARAIVPNVCEAIDGFDGTLVCTMDTHGRDYLATQEGRRLPVIHCQEGTDGWMFDPDVQDALGRYEGRTGQVPAIYRKGTFGSEALARDLAGCDANRHIGKVRLVGLCTDICVVSNALLLKAFLPETEIEVVAGCCAGVTPESHEAALKTMESCQVTVVR